MWMKMPVFREHARCHDRMYVRVPVDKVAEGLHCANNGWYSGIAIDLRPEHVAYRIVHLSAEPAQGMRHDPSFPA
jgi:hypothetical protein